MYDDSWYSFVPEIQHRRGPSTSQSGGHRRKESLLQQPNGVNAAADATQPLEDLFEEDQESEDSPPEATLLRRAKSYSDFYDVVTAQLSKDASKKQRRRRRRKDRSWEALSVGDRPAGHELVDNGSFNSHTDALLQASQQEYLLYHDQLAMTERHLDMLISDTNSALKLLESLSASFRAVEDQTSTFQEQCEGLLSEQRRLQTLADEVGTDLYYYAYLDDVTRRLNAPGAGRLVDDDKFGDVLATLDSCIAFMMKNPTYRDAETYLARYQALLTKALHLLEVGFTNRLDKVSAEISKQIAATQSESARHALAYGRFEEMIMESYSLIPNVQRVMASAYDPATGAAKSGAIIDIYTNTAKNLLDTFLTARDRDLKPMVQQDLEDFRAEAKSASPETACRNFVKLAFERSYNEAELLTKIFAVQPHYNLDPNSAFTVLKSYNKALVNGVSITPIATNIQSILQPTELQTICNVVGWIMSEYIMVDYDEDETPFNRHCRELSARLLTEHLWAFTDAAFEADIAKTITKAPVLPDQLKIGPVTKGVAASNAYPPVKRAIELLIMFDQSMPKERCQRDSPIVFKIVKESIGALQRAEARIKSSKNGTDSDLFMIMNLLLLKNELVSLEIGDVRNSQVGAGDAMQYFGQIWETLSPQAWVGFLGNLGSSIGSYIPGSSLIWSAPRGATPVPAAAAAASAAARPNGETQDASEQLDDLLRQNIYAFTARWGGQLHEARSRKLGGKNLVKIERDLDEILRTAFSNLPEVIDKLKEAIQISAEALQNQARAGETRGKTGR